MNLRSLSKGLILTVSSSLITIIICVVYTFTLGSRMTEARAIFIAEESRLRNFNSLSEAEKDDLKITLQKSLDLWNDPEVEKYLNQLEN